MHSVRLEPIKLILVCTRTTHLPSHRGRRHYIRYPSGSEIAELETDLKVRLTFEFTKSATATAAAHNIRSTTRTRTISGRSSLRTVPAVRNAAALRLIRGRPRIDLHSPSSTPPTPALTSSRFTNCTNTYRLLAIFCRRMWSIRGGCTRCTWKKLTRGRNNEGGREKVEVDSWASLVRSR